jgi:hypothetical protein
VNILPAPPPPPRTVRVFVACSFFDFLSFLDAFLVAILFLLFVVFDAQNWTDLSTNAGKWLRFISVAAAPFMNNGKSLGRFELFRILQVLLCFLGLLDGHSVSPSE